MVSQSSISVGTNGMPVMSAGITPISDDVLEGTEDFTITANGTALQMQYPGITLPDSITILIIDDTDGTYVSY